jgi:hypothetical protein
MKRSSSILTAIVLLGGMIGSGAAQVAPAPSQASEPGRVLGSVTSGNTTIIFDAANPSDIDSQPLTTWQGFAQQHPAIARALAFKPSLMNDSGYLKRHPELSAFFEAHPEVREAMAANPGNFNAIPPRPGE